MAKIFQDFEKLKKSTVSQETLKEFFVERNMMKTWPTIDNSKW